MPDPQDMTLPAGGAPRPSGSARPPTSDLRPPPSDRPTVRPSDRNRAAFTLVEVALALLVVSVGLLGAFSLFPSGLDAGKAAIDETRAAIFADEAFNTLRALSHSTTYTWSGATSFANATPPSLLPETWADAADLSARVTGNAVRLNRYVTTTSASRYKSSSLNPSLKIPEYALRYKLTVTDVPNSNLKTARLVVWPGEFGPTADRDGLIFYTEIYNGSM